MIEAKEALDQVQRTEVALEREHTALGDGANARSVKHDGHRRVAPQADGPADGVSTTGGQPSL